MKNYLWVLLNVIIIGFSACKKNCSSPANNNNQAISITNAITIKTGTLNFTNKNLSGIATIYKQTNGIYILAFEQMQFSSAIDIDVKVAKTDNTNDAAIKLFSIKTVSDHYYFELPSIDINSFNYLFLQSDVADAPVGSAWLK